MSQTQHYHIPIQGFEFLERVEKIHRQPSASPQNIHAKYTQLQKILEQSAQEATQGVTLTFANLFSRIDYICKRHKMVPSDRFAIQTMRRNCKKATEIEFIADIQEYLYDLRALARFISLVFDTDIPATLMADLPHSNRPHKNTKKERIPYLRVIVSHWNEETIYATTDGEEPASIVINYRKGGYDGSLTYIGALLEEHTQLNLLDVYIDENEQYIPHLIVFQPDYLLDISAIAACFKTYGHHPMNYFFNKIKPKETTYHILLGNLAGKLLDESIHDMDASGVDYSQSIKQFFHSNALDLCTCDIPQDFHKQARQQLAHLQNIVHEVLPHNVKGFDKEKILLEASFICEQLGVQGRVDMLQKDFSVLVEQKAGKKDEWRNAHREEHFVQMMLYQGVLMYNFGISPDSIHSFLLYSKYADGLMSEHYSRELFDESIRLRNQIVANELRFAKGETSALLSELTPELLNEKKQTNKLWHDYQQPEIERHLTILRQHSDLERAYFERYCTFVSKEQLLNKTGGSPDNSRGLAALWHLTIPEKLELGNILLGLRITAREKSAEYKGYDRITLRIPRQEDDFLPNFRKGDMVILYPYTTEPDVRKAILMKGNIEKLSPDTVTVLLRNGQNNKYIIGDDNTVFAIEHDISDTASGIGYRGLYSLMAGNSERRHRLLGIEKPRTNAGKKLTGNYGTFDDIVLKQKQAEDFFLLVGPPGTGKTSQALQYMVKEALAEGQNVLLLAYTNRAVDEICDMLLGSGIADNSRFIRIGSELSCDERFVPFLLKNSLNEQTKLSDIKKTIVDTPIFIGTVSSLNTNLHLFQLKHFELAIIDEASQVLEPDLLGILSATENGNNAIDKFTLIGDYKQLPAISQQSAEEAEIREEVLREHGFTDCRMSLFERLYKQSPDEVKAVLNKQGRMHPEIAEFPNQTFYRTERLCPIPLEHQQEFLPYGNTEAMNIWQELLINRRELFIASPAPPDNGLSDKSNIHEARIIAVLLREIHALTKEHFDAHKTVGVIVPYRNQIAMIRREILKLGIPALETISIDTVERYQGSQRDTILYSFTVRNRAQLNFLTAQTFIEEHNIIDRKLNVAITRARKQLILVGCPNVLSENPTFHKLIEHIRRKNGYVETNAVRFCKGDFVVPNYVTNWELNGSVYSLGEWGTRIAEEQIVSEMKGHPLSPASDYEACCYGRTSFDTPDAHTLIRIYDYYYWRKQYMAAYALWQSLGHLMRESLHRIGHRLFFCDWGYETGQTFIALYDSLFSKEQTEFISYIALQRKDFLRSAALRYCRFTDKENICTLEFSQATEIDRYFGATSKQISQVVVFNLSNSFERMTLPDIRRLAKDINRIVSTHPSQRYILLVREDGKGESMSHGYHVFVRLLHPNLRQAGKEMPVAGRYYYNAEKGAPEYGQFMYAVYTNF